MRLIDVLDRGMADVPAGSRDRLVMACSRLVAMVPARETRPVVNLPDDVWAMVFGWLGLRDLVEGVAKVNRKFGRIVGTGMVVVRTAEYDGKLLKGWRGRVAKLVIGKKRYPAMCVPGSVRYNARYGWRDEADMYLRLTPRLAEVDLTGNPKQVTDRTLAVLGKANVARVTMGDAYRVTDIGIAALVQDRRSRVAVSVGWCQNVTPSAFADAVVDGGVFTEVAATSAFFAPQKGCRRMSLNRVTATEVFWQSVRSATAITELCVTESVLGDGDSDIALVDSVLTTRTWERLDFGNSGFKQHGGGLTMAARHVSVGGKMAVTIDLSDEAETVRVVHHSLMVTCVVARENKVRELACEWGGTWKNVAKSMRLLEKLDVSNSRMVDDDECTMIAEQPWEMLREVNVSGCARVGANGVNVLAKVLGRPRAARPRPRTLMCRCLPKVKAQHVYGVVDMLRGSGCELTMDASGKDMPFWPFVFVVGV